MTTMTHDRPAGLGAVPGRRLLGAPLSPGTWRSYAYLWLVLLLAPLALGYVLLTVLLSAATAVTVVGLYGAGWLVGGGRLWGAVYRGLASRLLGVDVAAPLPRRPRRGPWRTLADAAGWRSMLFMVASIPLALAGLVVSTAFLVMGLGSVTYWSWHRLLPAELAMDDSWHTPGGLAVVAAGGLALVLLWPWVVRLAVVPLTLLTGALLGPTPSSLRIAELERSRAGTVQDADARLRRIERDLHDGTQARLVAVGMQLGEARELLAAGDPATVADLLEIAHASTKDALTELRELARGIHPPALDSGLSVALETLASRAPLPVGVHVGPDVEAPGRLAPAIESIVYFSIAELVTNAAKHARASRIDVRIEAADGDAVRIRVRDDGHGGATVVRPDGSGLRSGLAGLAERVRSVDGVFDLSSPAGGPTVVTMSLPAMRAAADAAARPQDGTS
ncbi:sensor histidine kinase [Myceligenerans pegani]|uniref:histidine kinase n=1 Tax=Myceligenerans pegani TaxID=2776917 RepID=A0ABR9N3F3_9MICO|nr:sensor histidine kinase [Myceligenerans sp. TRM 65318]MBE1878193.1 sensor domain-containing protein [Myceligenerans sp. TRM 65318]MBE3020464.1 sensor domain-containing protein [Myceligenerans sp. TRM 65318]